METVRAFLERLRHARPPVDLPERQRRLLVPPASAFVLHETIIRVDRLEPVRVKHQPGTGGEVAHLFAWRDLGHDSGTNINENDLGVDLTALLAVAAKRRIAFANEFTLKVEGVPGTIFLATGTAIDGELYGPASADTRDRFETLTRAIGGSPETSAPALGRAIRMRNAACCLAESDHSSAYGLLVAVLEGLSREFGHPSSTWSEWDQADDWDTFIRTIGLSEKQSDSLRARLLSRPHIRLRRTFIDYVVASVEPTFWDHAYWTHSPTVAVSGGTAHLAPGEWAQAGPIEHLVPRDLSVLRRRAGKSYDARSGVFHEGHRLDHRWILPFPGKANDPLSFAGLRRILDHALWSEAVSLAQHAPPLPDLKLINPAGS